MMIDGGIFIDRDPSSGFGGGVEDVLARLDRFGVQRALAASFRSVYFDYREGNAFTLTACARNAGRLLPMATVHVPGYDAAENYIARLKAEGFVALGLFPHWQSWSWRDYGAQAVAKDAAACRLPLQAGLLNTQDLADVARHLAPAGGTILVRWMRGGGYYSLADVVAVANDFPNLLFDVSNVSQAGGIRWLVERIGAERLYLASGIPLTLEGAPYFLLAGAGLNVADHAMIAGGSLERALALPRATGAAPSSDLWERYSRRPKIDTHWHTSGWNIIEPDIGFETMSRHFDAVNYQTVMTSSTRALNYDIVEGNEDTLAFVEADPRVHGMIVVDPLRTDVSILEIDRYRHNPRFVGIKTIQDFYGKRLDDPGYAKIFEHLQTVAPEMPVMAHLPGMVEAAIRFPDLSFVAAHSTWRHRDLAAHDNIWCDIATSTASRADVDFIDLIAAVGEDRVLFSCDGQLICTAWTLGKLASVDLPEPVLEKIFRSNALRAFPRLRQAGPG